MNPLDELHAITKGFRDEPLFGRVDHVAAALTPEPYKTLLVHDEHMTVTMEKYCDTPVEVRILEWKLEEDVYSRKIVLVKRGTDRVVQFGIVRFNLQYVTQPVRDEILKGETPLGRVLIDHNVLRHIDVGALLKIELGPALAEHLNSTTGAVTYGRLATIFCNKQPAVDLLEVPAPVPESR